MVTTRASRRTPMGPRGRLQPTRCTGSGAPRRSVLRLARPHLPAASAPSRVRGVDESGGEARVYLLDGDVVVKTQRPHRVRPRTSLRKEAGLLAALGDRLAGRISRLYGYDRRFAD